MRRSRKPCYILNFFLFHVPVSKTSKVKEKILHYLHGLLAHTNKVFRNVSAGRVLFCADIPIGVYIAHVSKLRNAPTLRRLSPLRAFPTLRKRSHWEERVDGGTDEERELAARARQQSDSKTAVHFDLFNTAYAFNIAYALALTMLII